MLQVFKCNSSSLILENAKKGKEKKEKLSSLSGKKLIIKKFSKNKQKKKEREREFLPHTNKINPFPKNN